MRLPTSYVARKALRRGPHGSTPSQPEPPGTQDFDILASLPFDGGNYDAGDAAAPLVLDWGFDSGPSGEVIPARPVTLSDHYVTIEPGNNTLDAIATFVLQVNGVPVPGMSIPVPASTAGTFYAAGPSALVAAGDRISWIINSAATVGSLIAPRMSVALLETP